MTVLVDGDVDALDLVRALGEVSPERRAQALGYRFDRDRRLSVAAYLLLKRALRETFGITGNPRLSRGANGKPYLTDYPDVHMNLSHCPKAAACAVSDRPIGIDVEAVAPIDWDVARRVLSDAELADVRASDEPETAFTCLWTRKEALVKLTGDGIDDARLPTLLTDTHGVTLETSVNRDRGYVLSTAEFKN